MRRILVTLAVTVAAMTPTAASASMPEPDPEAANCHGRAMGIGASAYRGTATFARLMGISVIDAHFAFMDLQGCHSD